MSKETKPTEVDLIKHFNEMTLRLLKLRTDGSQSTDSIRKIDEKIDHLTVKINELLAKNYDK